MDTRQPKQDRSRRTLERTLQVAERLLRDKPFEQIAVLEIVEAAGSSVGSFYARFGSKEGLLPHLYERYDQDLHRHIETALAKADWTDCTLADQARWFVDMHVTLCRKRRWLMRAVGLYARTEPQPLAGPMLRRRKQLHRSIAQTFEPHYGRIPRSDPARAVELGLYYVAAVCRDQILLAGPHARTTKISDRRLRAEMTHLFLAYLGVNDGPIQ